MKFKNSEKAVIDENRRCPIITFPILDKIPFIKHGFSTRLGGVSINEYTSMNLGYTRGDQKECVDKNYEMIANEIGFTWSDLVASDQIHETVVKRVGIEDLGKGIVSERDYRGVDGLITIEKNVPLVTYYADCVPLYFIDKKNQAIGLSHSGWRGTVKRMGQATIKAMIEEFNSKAEDILVVIGPSICQECYEVSEDVALEFSSLWDETILNKVLKVKENKKYDLNLWQANKQVLLDAGVLEENIHVSEVCTACNPELLYSHRIMGNKRGSLAAFLMLQ